MPSGEEKQTTNPGLQIVSRHPVVRLVVLALAAIAPALLAYTGGKGETSTVKDKAEAGYQLTLRDVENLKERVAKLEAINCSAEIAALKRTIRAAGKKPAKLVAAAPEPTPPPPPAPLPSSLDKALIQIQQEQGKP